MKKQILIFQILVSSVLTTNAQIYTPSNTIQGSSNNNSVGIGILPLYKFHSVSYDNTLAASAFLWGQYYGAAIGIQNTNPNYYAFLIQNGVTQNGNGGNSLFIVKGDGNTGIGTNSPISKLQINTSFSSALRIERVGSNVFGFEIGGTTFGLYDYTNSKYRWRTDGDNILIAESVGNLGIGTTNPQYKLDVKGTVRAQEVKVDINGADFVFEKDYKLMPLHELEKFIKEKKHLPEIAPAKEMEKNGAELGYLNSKLLQKLEEMTLYIIEQNKKIETLEQQVKELKEK